MEWSAARWATRVRGRVRSVLLVDGLFALVLGALAAQGSWSAAAGRGLHPGPAGYAMVVVAAAGLVVRRRRPLLGLAAAFGATMLYLSMGYPYSPILQLVSVAVYSVAAWCGERVSGAALAVLVAVYLPVGWWSGGTPWPGLGVVGLATVWLVVPWVTGVAVRSYRRARARQARAERRGDIAEERLRIAQEVHDVVGHSLAVINMQAGIALHVLDDRPGQAAEALRAVRQTSAAALDDLRVTLAPLSATGAGRDRRPAPGLDRIPELVASVHGSGVRVALIVDGTPAPVPAGVGLAAYRIVQESLTNVVRHARAQQATVRLCYGPAAVSVSVVDDGRGGDPVRTGGRGLTGMRRRAGAVGGTVDAGPAPEGGFAVRAILPLPAPDRGGRRPQ